MAEVGQRLGNGVYRLSALRNSQGRPVCTGDSPRALLVSCSFTHSRIKEDLIQVQPERKRATKRKSAKLYRVTTSKSQQENGTLELDSSRFIGFPHTRESLQAYKTALYLSARLQPLFREKLLPVKMTSWTGGAVPFHPDTFRSHQQLRAFCTAILILTDQGSERQYFGLKRLKLRPDTLQASNRSYSWRSAGDSEDPPLLYRSRTVYYDILRVSPAATQSQIKTAYYKQSFIYHPDKNPGNDEATRRFSEISEAYMVLGNIGLRRKYDRGILSQSDVQGAGRPSSKETRSTGSPQQQQQSQHQHRARRFSQAGGKTMFDFDAFYKAHYGEQLQRERDMRARKLRMQEEQKEKFNKWKQGKMVEMAMMMVMATAGLIFANLSRT